MMDAATAGLALMGFLLICTAAPSVKERDIDIYSFHINSTVTSRYAVTVITSRVANRLTESKEVHFEVKIPKNAFISKFRMDIEGKTYDGVVKGKEEAQQQYSRAVSRGESAGKISSVGRTLEEFKTSVTVAALSKVTFELTYEELLTRRHGKYQLLINTQPMQPVADFKIDVYIHENPGIAFLEVKGGLNTNELANAVTTTRSGMQAWVNFYPTREQQTTCAVCGENGLNGDLIVMYDVDRPKPSGELKVSGGHFVHYFAPTDVPRIPKNVVFVIDRSGSMRGRKIQQTRDALLKILGDLAEDDHFGLITFDHNVEVWKPELLQATEGNLKTAKDFVRNINAHGATDINAAVLKGVEMINEHPREGSASILILLTDGAPNRGESNPTRIQANVKEAIAGKFPLYCLGFGFDVNFNFLEKMALENKGLARRIYEDSDADLQLQGFYEEVATPLLTGVQLKYPGGANLTQTIFSHYYNGSEIVVAGQITDNSLDTFQMEVIAVSKNTKVTYQDSVLTKDLVGFIPPHGNFIPRLWAYLTVKQLLEKEMTFNGAEKEAARKEVLDLSLKYQFVTPLTSMVVTKPEGEEAQVAHKPKEGEERKQKEHGPMLAGSPIDVPLLQSRFSRIPDYNYYQPDRGFYFDSPPLRSRGSSHWQQGMSSMPLMPGVRTSSARTSDVRRSDERMSGVRMSDERRAGVRMSDERRFGVQTSVLQTPVTPTAVSTVRFLVSSRDQPKPLCYDLLAASKLRLLMDSSSGFSMNGELSSKGFKRIVLLYKVYYYLMLHPSMILYNTSQNAEVFSWGQEPTKREADSVSVILRKDEVDITMGSVRVVVFLHKKDGEVFLWPAVQQQPHSDTIQGVFGQKHLEYEELPESGIKIKDKHVTATWSTATDYRRSSAPVLGCWLVPYQSVLQGELSDFTVSQL